MAASDLLQDVLVSCSDGLQILHVLTFAFSLSPPSQIYVSVVLCAPYYLLRNPTIPQLLRIPFRFPRFELPEYI